MSVESNPFDGLEIVHESWSWDDLEGEVVLDGLPDGFEIDAEATEDGEIVAQVWHEAGEAARREA